jgi:hypothetical protein
MYTEITELKKYIRIYNDPPNAEAFSEAMKVLTKYYKQFGTIDVPTIQNLIK